MALSELANTADSATAGKTADWGKLLQAEFDKARLVQSDHRDLERNREVEQAVVSVFLHSPRGGKVTTFELQRLAGTSGPDAIEFEKGLLRWRDVSWFLDDEDSNDDDGQSLPKEWRLGTRPNLRNMHDEACARRVTDADVTERLLQTVRKCRSKLDGGAAAAGAKCHLLPASPADVADDGDFHYVILGPEATSDSGRPSSAAKRCIDVKSDEEARFVKDLAAPFARDPRLPKLLDTRILLSTVLQGVERGLLVARLVRPDGTRRTWWREPVESSAAADPALEAVLPEEAQLESLHVPLLTPGRLPGLWPSDGGSAAEQRLPVRDLLACFAGGHVVQVAKQGYDDALAVPACPPNIVLEAVREAVEAGALWLVNGPSSCWKDRFLAADAAGAPALFLWSRPGAGVGHDADHGHGRVAAPRPGPGRPEASGGQRGPRPLLPRGRLAGRRRARQPAQGGGRPAGRGGARLQERRGTGLAERTGAGTSAGAELARPVPMPGPGCPRRPGRCYIPSLRRFTEPHDHADRLGSGARAAPEAGQRGSSRRPPDRRSTRVQGAPR